MNRSEIESRLHAFVEYFHDNDPDGAAAMFAEDGVAQHWTGQKVIGRAAIRKELTPFFEEGQVLRYDVERVDVDEENNVAWSIWTMTLTRGETTTIMRGVDTFEFEDGLIKRNAVYMQTDQPQISFK